MGITTGIDIQKLIDAGNFISQKLGRHNESRVGKAGLEIQREAIAACT
jgi:hydroxymethylglutaryl-CoA lyase